MFQKHFKDIPLWFLAGLIALGIDLLNALRVMFAGWDRVGAPFWDKLSYFIGAGGCFHFLVAFLIGCLIGKIFSKEWKKTSYAKRGAIFGSMFGLLGYIFIGTFIALFAESYLAILFLPLVGAVFGLGMRGTPAGTLETLFILTICTGVTVAFYALVGAGIGKFISNLKKRKI